MSRNITHDGQTLTIAEWADKTGQSPQLLHYRLNSGWPIADALTKPTGKRGRAPYSDGALAEREKAQKAARIKDSQIRREFSKLINELDRSLNAFHFRLADILDAQPDDRGAIKSSGSDRPDQLIRTVQERL